jgi:chromate reductase, NAD(P)H dehydrogenase (quinone)
MTRLLVFAGSARRDSLNKKLAAAAAELARAAGAEVEWIDLADYPMPLYDGDLEEGDGIPTTVTALRDKMAAADGFILACPEYNSSITPLLKNVIDWTSRPQSESAPSLIAYRGKVAAIVSASPGPIGGMRGLVHVRAILSSIGVLVVPGDVAISNAFQAFDESGRWKDESAQKRLNTVVGSLVKIAGSLAT